ncbi:MAG: hypothetical protein CMA04_000170 [Methanobacteriota archaeon]|nr:MAG: hypothetical protein CMA04_000170 [Euryarchaeota archaeon]
MRKRLVPNPVCRSEQRGDSTGTNVGDKKKALAWILSQLEIRSISRETWTQQQREINAGTNREA